MPTISIFYGIVIMMFRGNMEHNPPHFHARYQDYEATFNFDGEIINGKMPAKQVKLIAAWAAIHYDELENNWQLAAESKSLDEIEPLK